jgi:hypothetical protein
VRHARLHQVEIAASIGSIVLLLFLVQLGLRWDAWSGVITFVSAVLLLGQPYALLRLLEHVRPVPREVLWTAIGCAALGLVALIVLPYPRPPAFLVATAACFGAFQGYAAWAFIDEARRRAGVTRTRAWLAGAGASIATALVVIEGVGWIFGIRPLLLVYALLSLGMVACYGLGLAPPRRVLRSWQQRELIRLLRRTAETAPQEREDHLADNLNSAASRGVTAAATAVLLGRKELTVYAGTEPNWEGRNVTPDVGLVGVALGGVNPVVGSADECERPLNEFTGGDVVAAIPIARSAPGWGVLVVVERRASLYLPDDLELLGALCRHAADVLDHARLMHEERRRQQRAADIRLPIPDSPSRSLV